MSLYLHLSIHFLSALIAGYIVWKIWQKPLVSFAAGIIGGFFIDLDHFIDYFLAFGWSFNFNYFINSHQYLKADKVYVLFHAWEYVILLIIAVMILNNKTLKSALLALALGILFHLSADVVINEGLVKSYSIIHRAKNNFETEKLVLPEQFRNHLMRKSLLNL